MERHNVRLILVVYLIHKIRNERRNTMLVVVKTSAAKGNGNARGGSCGVHKNQ